MIQRISLFSATQHRARQFYQCAQWLSIDVALAAMAGGIMAQRLTAASVRPGFYWILPLAVWTVYTLDHLLDGRRVGADASTHRHRIHYEFAKPLWIGFVLATLACLALAIDSLSTEGVYFGLGMSVLVVAHLGIVKLAGARISPLLAKELGVAIIFTAGVWGLPVLRRTISPWPVEAMIQYLLLAIANLIIFSTFEREIDEADGHTSFVRFTGKRNAMYISTGVLSAQIPLAILCYLRIPTRATTIAEFILLAIAMIMGVILLVPGYFSHHERYRTWGDGAFLLPFLMLAIR